jgi:hypothetical protein
MPVDAGVVKEILVDRTLAQVLERLPLRAAAPVRTALEAPLELTACDGGALDLRMRTIGYLSRVVEEEMFEPARAPLEELGQQLEDRLAAGLDWPAAVRALSAELASQEPLPKPSPDDAGAVSWRVPGPGGHVRHYLVAAAIADSLPEEGQDGADLPPGVSDAGELKRCWTYGFLVRCCEEALPPSATKDSDELRS